MKPSRSSILWPMILKKFVKSTAIKDPTATPTTTHKASLSEEVAIGGRILKSATPVNLAA